MGQTWEVLIGFWQTLVDPTVRGSPSIARRGGCTRVAGGRIITEILYRLCLNKAFCLGLVNTVVWVKDGDRGDGMKEDTICIYNVVKMGLLFLSPHKNGCFLFKVAI